MTATAAGPGLDRDIPIEDETIVEEERVGNAIAVVDTSTALTALEKGQIDIQVATAKEYPRSVSKSLAEATTLATLDEETAESMLYAVERGKGKSAKVIEGPSARLAEVMAYSWGNLRVDADIVGQDKKFVTAMSMCWDLEKNVGIRIRVKRRITDKSGNTFNDDLIGVTSNAALSIALRNSVFKVIPRAFVDRVYRKARTASLGAGGTFTQKRQKAMDWFAKIGVKPEEIFAKLGIAGIDDINEDHYVTLRGLSNAIREGEMTVETVFRSATSASTAGADELNNALGGSAKTAPSMGTTAKPAPGNAESAAEAPQSSTSPSTGAEVRRVKGKKPCELCESKPGEPHKSECPDA